MPVFDPSDVARWCGGEWSQTPVRPLRGVCTNSREVGEDSLFIALKGERFDGHDFLDEAFAGGAAAAVVRDRVRGGQPQLVVPDTRPALVDLARGYRDSLPGTFIGITGSAGKTTVKELLASMLEATAPTARTHGNWNNDIGLPLSLLRMEAAHRFGVFEVGTNHPGEIATLCRVLRPHAGVMTTVGVAHLEFFGSEEAIAEEKSSLFAAIPPPGWAVVCADEPWFPVFRDAASCRLVTVSGTGPADYTWSGGRGGMTLHEQAGGESVDLPLPVPGEFFQRDVVLAAAAARQAGVAWPAIRSAVETYRSPPMRWEVTDAGGVTIVNDSYNANPLSVREALKAFQSMPVRGRRWLVLGAMLELGPTAADLHRALGRTVAADAWAGLVAFGPWGVPIAEGAESAGMEPGAIQRCRTHDEAAAFLAGHVQPGDAVLAKASRGERLETMLPLLAARIENLGSSV